MDLCSVHQPRLESHEKLEPQRKEEISSFTMNMNLFLTMTETQVWRKNQRFRFLSADYINFIKHMPFAIPHCSVGGARDLQMHSKKCRAFLRAQICFVLKNRWLWRFDMREKKTDPSELVLVKLDVTVSRHGGMLLTTPYPGPQRPSAACSHSVPAPWIGCPRPPLSRTWLAHSNTGCLSNYLFSAAAMQTTNSGSYLAAKLYLMSLHLFPLQSSAIS